MSYRRRARSFASSLIFCRDFFDEVAILHLVNLKNGYFSGATFGPKADPLRQLALDSLEDSLNVFSVERTWVVLVKPGSEFFIL